MKDMKEQLGYSQRIDIEIVVPETPLTLRSFKRNAVIREIKHNVYCKRQTADSS